MSKIYCSNKFLKSSIVIDEFILVKNDNCKKYIQMCIYKIDLKERLSDINSLEAVFKIVFIFKVENRMIGIGIGDRF